MKFLNYLMNSIDEQDEKTSQTPYEQFEKCMTAVFSSAYHRTPIDIVEQFKHILAGK